MKIKFVLAICGLSIFCASTSSYGQNLEPLAIGTKYHFSCRPTSSSETVTGEFKFISRDTYLTIGDGKWVDGTVIQVESLNVRTINYNQTTPASLTGIAKCWDTNATRPGGFSCETVGNADGLPYSLKFYWNETSDGNVAFHLNNKTYMGTCTPTRLQ